MTQCVARREKPHEIEWRVNQSTLQVQSRQRRIRAIQREDLLESLEFQDRPRKARASCFRVRGVKGNVRGRPQSNAAPHHGLERLTRRPRRGPKCAGTTEGRRDCQETSPRNSRGRRHQFTHWTHSLSAPGPGGPAVRHCPGREKRRIPARRPCATGGRHASQ